MTSPMTRSTSPMRVITSPSKALISSTRHTPSGTHCIVGAALLVLSLLSIYQSHHCSHLNQPDPHDAPTKAYNNRGLIVGDFPSSTSPEDDSSNNNPSLDDPPPLQVSEEEAMKTAEEGDAAADVVVEETRKRKHRIKQVNATIATFPTWVKEPGCLCELQTPPWHAKTLARFFVFQRDGRHQLRDFVTHYTRVLPYNSLVIMDHAGTDQYTQSLLEQYGAKGAHIWKCQGQFKAKASMWSKVIRTYAQDSGFVFPVDIDELLAVKVDQGLQWNLEAFKDALYGLSKSGKPYKMNWIESVPSECHVYMKGLPEEATTTDDDGLYASDMCDIRFVKSKEVGCMDKTFSRGVHFHKTDTGNHYGGTRKFPKLSKQVCEDKGLEEVYEISRLALVHLKEKTFEDWLVHGLRGATDRGFASDFNIDCDGVKQSLHYCRKWEKITRAKFSPYELRKIYVEDVCPDPEIPLLPVQDAFCEREGTEEQ